MENTEKVFGSFKAQAANSAVTGVKKNDVFMIPPTSLLEEEGFNERDYTDPDVEAQIEAFAQAYQQGQFVPPLVVRIDATTGEFFIVDGHQRRRGALRAIERGTPIEHLVCVPFRGNNVDRVVCMLTSSEGLKLKPLGVARGYLRLLRLGQSVSEIAKGVGRTSQHVESMLVLAEANADVQGLVNSGAVSATTAIETVREHGEKAGDLLAKKLAEAKAQGKTKVKPSAIKQWAPPRKHAVAIYSSVGTLVKQLRLQQRPLFEKLKSDDGQALEDLKGQTVQVDAITLAQLLDAYEHAQALEAKTKD